MGQPRSGCSSWFDNLVGICEDLLSRNRDHHNTTSTGNGPGGLDQDNQWVSNDEEMFDGAQEEWCGLASPKPNFRVSTPIWTWQISVLSI